jgi:hypothetical protein
MYFQCRDSWHSQFREQDLKTPLPHKLHIAFADKVIALVEGAANSLTRRAVWS